jgi:hypothetical protein|tara:strand:+ start:2466 stop:2693 length:228 start_codon:yes stop_codon:yes gene_type:complete
MNDKPNEAQWSELVALLKEREKRANEALRFLDGTDDSIYGPGHFLKGIRHALGEVLDDIERIRSGESYELGEARN